MLNTETLSYTGTKAPRFFELFLKSWASGFWITFTEKQPSDKLPVACFPAVFIGTIAASPGNTLRDDS